MFVSSRFGRLRRSDDSQRGAVLVEFAFVFMMFLVFVFGMIDFGLGINTLTEITNGSREGARLGIVGGSQSEIEDRVRSMWPNLDQSALTVTVTCEKPDDSLCTGSSSAGDLSNGATGDSVVVTVSYAYTMITPLPSIMGLGPTWDLSSTTEMRLE